MKRFKYDLFGIRAQEGYKWLRSGEKLTPIDGWCEEYVDGVAKINLSHETVNSIDWPIHSRGFGWCGYVRKLNETV